MDLLLGHLLGQGDDHVVAPHGSRERQPNAGIAGGGFDQRIAGLDAAARFGVENHLLANAILNGSSRVHELTLGPCITVIIGKHRW